MKEHRLRTRIVLGAVVLGLVLCLQPLAPPSAQAAAANAGIVTPPEHRRGTEQTYLTFPEWFLVHSPAEYAQYVKSRTPTDFPFLGHIGQFWQSYAAIYGAANDGYPFNLGYHVMVMVIGVSTSIEYALRSAYETLVGRISELTAPAGLSEEDRYGARVAQEYVDFIRVQPWYEFDFGARLRGLWTDTGWWGPDVVRKWERKYALTTEYLIKAGYGWLIKKATKASYDEPLPVTAVVLERAPGELAAQLPELKVLARNEVGSMLATFPRYQAFTTYAATAARSGVSFREIAGNGSVILISVLAPVAWKPTGPAYAGSRELFVQPILTQPSRKRVALVVPVPLLAAVLNAVAQAGIELEHVYDY